MDKEIIQAIEARLNATIHTVETVSGGDINDAALLHCGNRKLFVKTNRKGAGRDDMFQKEWKGLEILRSAAAIRVPQPLLEGETRHAIYLVMEWIGRGRPAPEFWRRFAEDLAKLHRHTSDMFGLDHDNYIGSLPQPNSPSAGWADFYAAQRILFLTRRAFDEKKCERRDLKAVEWICNRLNELFPEEPPSLLHGDLWSGNFMVDENGEPAIYDPAVYYGHREMDLGMSLLFGGFDQRFYEHYHQSWPLEAGWRNRVELAQLYPLLVHLLLFGGHYYNSVQSVLRKYG